MCHSMLHFGRFDSTWHLKCRLTDTFSSRSADKHHWEMTWTENMITVQYILRVTQTHLASAHTLLWDTVWTSLAHGFKDFIFPFAFGACETVPQKPCLDCTEFNRLLSLYKLHRGSVISKSVLRSGCPPAGGANTQKQKRCMGEKWASIWKANNCVDQNKRPERHKGSDAINAYPQGKKNS